MSFNNWPLTVCRKFLLFAVILGVVGGPWKADACCDVGYGKHCDHDDDCHDFRLVCSLETNNCVCSRFFELDPETKICHFNMTELKDFLASIGQERDFRGELDAEARSTFNQLGFAGILALSLGLLGGVCCVFAFCVLDRKGSDHDKLLNEQPTKHPNMGASSSATPIDAPAVIEPVFDMAVV